jgi:RNA polymerase sigma factor (sigma-70 family)
MAEPDSFVEFVRRVRAGDERAAVELLRQYEPAVRLEVRLHLRDTRLRQLFDSMDICQSVLGSFFVRLAAGQFDLDRPEKLLKLLVTITRRKVAYQARKQRTQSRDHRRVAPLELHQAEAIATDPSPSRVAAGKELLEKLRRGLNSEERHLADLRAQGLGWTEIADTLGGTPQARRMQLARAVDRVARQLGLEEDHE